MEELRAQFPVLERVAYLNAGTNGPVPRTAFEAAEASLREQLEDGRSGAPLFERADRAHRRAARAGRARCSAPTSADVAITELHHRRRQRGAARARPAAGRRGADKRRGAPRRARRRSRPRARRRGVRVRVVPFDELPGAVEPETRAGRLLARVLGHRRACSIRALLAALGRARRCSTAPRASAPCRWTCARSAATSTRPRARSGCAGPSGIGYLYARAELVRRACPAPWPGYHALAHSERGARAGAHAGRPPARHRLPRTPPHRVGARRARRAGASRDSSACTSAASAGAERLAGLLRERGLRWRRAARSTLVSFEVADPPASVERLARARASSLRELPGHGRTSGPRSARGRARRRSSSGWRRASRTPLVAEQRHDPEHDRRDHHGEAEDSRPRAKTTASRRRPLAAELDARGSRRGSRGRSTTVTPIPATSETQITSSRASAVDDRARSRRLHRRRPPRHAGLLERAREQHRRCRPGSAAETTTGPARRCRTGA